MFDQMGGEYDRFRIENLIKKTTLGELLHQKKIKIVSKLTKAD
jgi:hypothetical protein